MSWTDETTVRKHLLDLDRAADAFTGVPVALDAAGKGTLPHRGIEDDSEAVKVLAGFEPESQAGVTLSGESWAALNHQNLLPDSMVAAESADLETVYQLDKDYAADWVEGRLRRISGGAIASGQAVQVYYRRFTILLKGADYAIDYAAGEISPGSGGGLEPDVTVFVDYRVSAASGSGQLIPQSIAEAEDLIL